MQATSHGALDAAGVGLAVALAGWAFVASAGRAGARPWPFAGCVAVGVVSFAAGRLLRRWTPTAPGAAVVVVALVAFVMRPGSVNQSGGGVLRYANANAALFGLGVIGALSVCAASDRLEVERPIAVLVAVGFAVLTALTGSVAGVVALIAAFLIAIVARRLASVVALALILLAIGLTAAFALRAPVHGNSDFAVRTRLWHEAVRLAHSDEVRGIGPGRFAAATTVTRDADLRWAHDEYLQVNAELGVVGLALVLLVLGWAAVRVLAAARTAQPAAMWGAGALACTGLHASVDYVAHFPVVVALTAVLVGAGATGRRRARRGSRGSHLLRR